MGGECEWDGGQVRKKEKIAPGSYGTLHHFRRLTNVKKLLIF